MLNKWSIKARLTKAEKEGLARLMEAVRLKRIAAGVNGSFTLPVEPERSEEEGANLSERV